MNTPELDTKLYGRRTYNSPSDVLLFKVPNHRDRSYRNDRKKSYHAHHENKRHLPPIVGLRVSRLDLYDPTNSSYNWQRYSDKTTQLSPAPDVLYRNTYLEELKREKTARSNKHRSLSSSHSKLNTSSSSMQTEFDQQENSSFQPNGTIYDYIRESIRQIEQQRKSKQDLIPFRIQRPLNEDITFRRLVKDKKCSSITSSTTTVVPPQSSLFHNELKSPESFVSYINYSRASQSTTPNQSSVIFQNES